MNNEMLEAKEISVEGLEMIGQGFAADVFKDGDKVIKLYNEKRTRREYIERNYRVARYMMNCGLPVVKVYDFISCNDRYGITYEYIDGVDLREYFARNMEERRKCAAIMGDCMRALHSQPVYEKLDAYSDRGYLSILEKNSLIDQKYADQIRRMLDELGGPRVMVHCDFHEGNFMVDKNGKFVMIDLDSTTIGSPIFDLGYVFHGEKELPEEIRKERFGLTEEEMQESIMVMLEHYFDTTDREVLTRYSRIIDHAFRYYRFYENYKLHLKANKPQKEYFDAAYPQLIEELTKLNEEIEQIDWSVLNRQV